MRGLVNLQVYSLNLEKGETIAFCGDIHADSTSPSSRIDDIQETLSKKLNDMLTKCISYKVKYLFFEGDIFNKIQCTHECVNRLGEDLLKFKSKGIGLFTILGNHDIVRNNLDNMVKAPIQTLFNFGVLTHISLNKRVVINRDILITPVDYTEYPTIADNRFKVNILLAHMFYNQSELMGDERHNLSREVMGSLGYTVAFLGHDHEEYPVDKTGKTYVVRSGSLLRGTSHSYNFTRKPKFVVVTDIYNICEDTLKGVELEHADYSKIASEYVINKKNMSNTSEMKALLSSLAGKLMVQEDSSDDRILSVVQNDPNLPVECRSLLLHYFSEG